LNSYKKPVGGGIVLYYNTDVTPGTSGAGIFTKDKETETMDPGFVTANFGFSST